MAGSSAGRGSGACGPGSCAEAWGSGVGGASDCAAFVESGFASFVKGCACDPSIATLSAPWLTRASPEWP